MDPQSFLSMYLEKPASLDTSQHDPEDSGREDPGETEYSNPGIDQDPPISVPSLGANDSINTRTVEPPEDASGQDSGPEDASGKDSGATLEKGASVAEAGTRSGLFLAPWSLALRGIVDEIEEFVPPEDTANKNSDHEHSRQPLDDIEEIENSQENHKIAPVPPPEVPAVALSETSTVALPETATAALSESTKQPALEKDAADENDVHPPHIPIHEDLGDVDAKGNVPGVQNTNVPGVQNTNVPEKDTAEFEAEEIVAHDIVHGDMDKISGDVDHAEMNGGGIEKDTEENNGSNQDTERDNETGEDAEEKNGGNQDTEMDNKDEERDDRDTEMDDSAAESNNSAAERNDEDAERNDEDAERNDEDAERNDEDAERNDEDAERNDEDAERNDEDAEIPESVAAAPVDADVDNDAHMHIQNEENVQEKTSGAAPCSPVPPGVWVKKHAKLGALVDEDVAPVVPFKQDFLNDFWRLRNGVCMGTHFSEIGNDPGGLMVSNATDFQANIILQAVQEDRIAKHMKKERDDIVDNDAAVRGALVAIDQKITKVVFLSPEEYTPRRIAERFQMWDLSMFVPCFFVSSFISLLDNSVLYNEWLESHAVRSEMDNVFTTTSIMSDIHAQNMHILVERMGSTVLALLCHYLMEVDALVELDVAAEIKCSLAQGLTKTTKIKSHATGNMIPSDECVFYKTTMHMPTEDYPEATEHRIIVIEESCRPYVESIYLFSRIFDEFMAQIRVHVDAYKPRYSMAFEEFGKTKDCTGAAAYVPWVFSFPDACAVLHNMWFMYRLFFENLDRCVPDAQ